MTEQSTKRAARKAYEKALAAAWKAYNEAKAAADKGYTERV